MEAEIKRILGIILIIIGLAIFYWDISSSYYYFTAQKEFPQVFIQPAADTSNNQPTGGSTIQDQMNALVGQQINEQIKKLIPSNTVTELLNVSVWSIFAFILIYAAGKAVGMGRDFLKDAREDSKSQKQNTSQPVV